MSAFLSNRSGFWLALTLVLCVLAFQETQAQVRTAYTLQGTVTDDEGSPLPNVTIRLRLLESHPHSVHITKEAPNYSFRR